VNKRKCCTHRRELAENHRKSQAGPWAEKTPPRRGPVKRWGNIQLGRALATG